MTPKLMARDRRKIASVSTATSWPLFRTGSWNLFDLRGIHWTLSARSFGNALKGVIKPACGFASPGRPAWPPDRVTTSAGTTA